MKVEFVSWDWKGSYGADDLIRVINAFQGGPVYAAAVDHGCDGYVVALSDQPISPAEATAAWLSS